LLAPESPAVGNCRASGLSKLKHGPTKPKSHQSVNDKQKDISAYFRNSFAFQKRYFRLLHT